ncbi:hypothetical protein V1J52_24430 [Streptomyces sp. TRM 70351]|uniref:hypothetical protein n=1 Tax=Streptomyces sp. TRM 70351 TaxID=3116552 RepID=UPI002E7AEAA4|nr:hypothetical protein [Streptomyces sp. TRM 70351]MEE1931281.1 hypothetical protein [Streptomyces sp. TRM 70351]
MDTSTLSGSLPWVQTLRWHATVVTARASMLIVLISLPFLLLPVSFPPRVLPCLMLCLAASHGSVLIHHRFRRR